MSSGRGRHCSPPQIAASLFGRDACGGRGHRLPHGQRLEPGKAGGLEHLRERVWRGGWRSSPSEASAILLTRDSGVLQP